MVLVRTVPRRIVITTIRIRIIIILVVIVEVAPCNHRHPLMIDPLGFTGDMPELGIINAVVGMIGMIPIVFIPTIRIRIRIPIRMGNSTTRRFPLGTTQRMGIRPQQRNHISLHHVTIHDDTPVRREKHYDRTFTTKRVVCRWWDIYVPNYPLWVLRH